MSRTTAPSSASRASGEAPGEGLRERKKRATRQALQQAAVKLFRERGPAAVTVEDICTAAEVSPRTFFNYFTAKEEVLVPWDPATVAGAPERIVARPADESPLRVLQVVLDDALDTAMAGPTWRDQALVLRDHPELVSRVALASRDLESALCDGLGQRIGTGPDEYVRLLAATAVTALRVSIQCWQQADADATLREFLQRAFQRLADGLHPHDLPG